jgi:hypothetical protein
MKNTEKSLIEFFETKKKRAQARALLVVMDALLRDALLHVIQTMGS